MWVGKPGDSINIRDQVHAGIDLVVLLRWDGRDSKGHLVKPGRYEFTVTATGSHYQKTARGSVRVVAAT